ncbi:hypothetical protein KSF78_0001703 [Schistosoma japonicum]|nr:hypothetical protein KSF78_0001703 [Schistosoma japonicum]
MFEESHDHMKEILCQYEVVEYLGKGCQGTSYKLRRRDNLQFYVLKMQIECRSLEHAHTVFKEFNHAQRFVHPYVPRILEIHVSMNSRNLAIYVSIIRRFIDLPSVESIIHDNIGKTSVNWKVRSHQFCIYSKGTVDLQNVWKYANSFIFSIKSKIWLYVNRVANNYFMK